MTEPDNTPPEPSWKYRRIYTFVSAVINSAGVAAIIWKITDGKALMWIALALILANLVLTLMYIGGAAVTDLAQLANFRFRFGNKGKDDV